MLDVIEQRILLAILRSPGSSLTQILRAVGGGPTSVNHARKRLLEKGLIAEVYERKGKIRWNKQTLTRDGQRVAELLAQIDAILSEKATKRGVP